MDWIVSLPYTLHGYNTVYTIIDWFSKLIRFIPCKTDINAKGLACLFFEHWIYGFSMLENC